MRLIKYKRRWIFTFNLMEPKILMEEIFLGPEIVTEPKTIISASKNEKVAPVQRLKEGFALLPYRWGLFMSRGTAFALLVDYIRYMTRVIYDMNFTQTPGDMIPQDWIDKQEIWIGRAASICNNTSKKILAAKMRDGTILRHITSQYDPETFWPVLLKIKQDRIRELDPLGESRTEEETRLLNHDQREPIDAYTLYGGEDQPKRPKRPIEDKEFKFEPWGVDADTKLEPFGGRRIRILLDNLVKKNPEFN